MSRWSSAPLLIVLVVVALISLAYQVVLSALVR